MLKLYVGCALTHAPELFRARVAKLIETFKQEYEVLEFKGLAAGTDRDVYLHDIHECVRQCDFFVAICDYPSLGLGYELSAAVESFQKPTLALAHRDITVTRLIRGIDHLHFQFARYEQMDEIPERARRFIAAHRYGRTFEPTRRPA